MALNKYIHRPKNLVIDDLEIEYNISKRMFDEIADTRGNKNLNPYIYVIDYINECQGAEDNKIKTIIPTVNGVHLITIGFNVQQFKTKLEEAGIEPIDIQKDNPTLLYYAKPE